MSSFKYLAAGALSLYCAANACAQTVIHFTGSTAFRASTVAAIENKMGGAGNFKAAYFAQSGVTGIRNANQCVIQGTIAGLPAGANPVTIKCSWSGSTGGIKTLVENIDVSTWMSVTNLPGTNTSASVASPSYTLDAAAFPGGETAKADVTMEDSAQATTGFTGVSFIEHPVGVLVFEWVANNGSPAALDNITQLQAEAAITNGGLPLSQLTGNSADINKAVYVLGRNFDSGTRLSCLAETGISVFSSVRHIFPIVSGSAGANGSSITGLKLWPAETVLGTAYGIGQSGFASGGTLADNLATPGSSTADTGPTSVPNAQERVLFGNGYLIGYLGRGDASRACRRTNIATNDAHRIKWNGMSIWNGAIDVNGNPASYNDFLVTEGLYQLWEYEKLAYRNDLAATKQMIANGFALEIETNTATLSGTKLSDMNVSKPVEGGLITHN